jgi:tRNA(Ile)-lysidine synthase
VLNRFQSFIEENAPEIITGKTLLAISGGADSVAMGHLFYRSGYRFEIAHVNYGLRGEESVGDEVFVKSLSATWNVPLHVARPDTLAEAQLHGESVQMAARRLRYSFFKQLMNGDLTIVCTAHQRTDNLEHLFIYLLRNSPAAWQGIPLRRDYIFRPMLFADAAEIRQWMNAEDLEWREDSSNQKTDYLRNKVRHRILPLIRDTFPEAESEFAELSKSLSALRHKELDQNHQWLQQFPLVGDGRMLNTHDMPAVMKYLKSMGMHPVEVQKLLLAGTGSRFYFHGWMAEVRNAGIWVGKPIGQTIEETHIPNSSELPVCVQAGKFLLSLYTLRPGEITMTAENTWFFDMDSIIFPLTLRNRVKGERMQPFGMQGSKKISDLLVDAHIPASEKDAYPIFTHAEGILGVPDIRRSAMAPVQENTHKILCVKWEISDNHAES